MHIPRFWAKAKADAVRPDGVPVEVGLWRGSLTSLQEAQQLARDAAARVAARIGRGEGFPDRYAYGTRAMREPIEAEGAGYIVTRNAYGARVLNAVSAMFIDVDLPEGADEPPSGLRKLFGRSEPADPAAPVLTRLQKWIDGGAGRGARAWRTKAGVRVLVTHAPYTPGAAEAEAVMNALGADPQYVKLCRAQKCFRARLTPKPWRCGLRPPRVRFPFDSPDQEEQMQGWIGEYQSACDGFATCRPLGHFGADAVHPDIAQLLAVHDEETRTESGLPLA